MTGQQLKKKLQDHGITGVELAKLMDRIPETVYIWFAKPLIKRGLLQDISKATDISVDDLTGVTSKVEEPETAYGVIHHGDQAFAALRYKGFSVSKFSDLMGETRPTTYKWFEEKNWDEGRLLQAAHILHVPVGQLKGKGQGVQSFEKDVYLMLQKNTTTIRRKYSAFTKPESIRFLSFCVPISETLATAENLAPIDFP